MLRQSLSTSASASFGLKTGKGLTKRTAPKLPHFQNEWGRPPSPGGLTHGLIQITYDTVINLLQYNHRHSNFRKSQGFALVENKLADQKVWT